MLPFPFLRTDALYFSRILLWTTSLSSGGAGWFLMFPFVFPTLPLSLPFTSQIVASSRQEQPVTGSHRGHRGGWGKQLVQTNSFPIALLPPFAFTFFILLPQTRTYQCCQLAALLVPVPLLGHIAWGRATDTCKSLIPGKHEGSNKDLRQH